MEVGRDSIVVALTVTRRKGCAVVPARLCGGRRRGTRLHTLAVPVGGSEGAVARCGGITSR